MAKRKKCFVDIETTGLDWDYHHAIEIAYMTEDMEKPITVIPCAYTPNIGENLSSHTVWGFASEKAMEINKFYERFPNGVSNSGIQALTRMEERMKDCTLVGANIRFDARFIEKVIGFEPWHHRLLDIEAYIAGHFNLDYIPSFSECQKLIADAYGATVTKPNHTAYMDCLSVAEAYRALPKR